MIWIALFAINCRYNSQCYFFYFVKFGNALEKLEQKDILIINPCNSKTCVSTLFEDISTLDSKLRDLMWLIT